MTRPSTASEEAKSLLRSAEAVLRSNWTGEWSVPSRRQYPHQWGWDTAFIAIGWSWLDERRAAQELESLLRGQWSDGRVPHIVFHPDVPDDAYFPGPGFWRSSAMAGSPTGVNTSGLTQPPLQARAALEVARRSRHGEAALAFLARVLPRLEAQQSYLSHSRDAGGAGLAAIVHPWESGLDDSPAWDDPLAAVELPPEGVAPYRRRDRGHVDARERPSDAAYDRFVHLASAYREQGYADAGLAEGSAFLVEDPSFNAIWLWSTHALVEIAELVGADAGPHRETATRLHEALVSRLWDPDRERFLARDLRADRLVDRRTVLSLAPLLDPDLPPAIVQAVAGELESPHFRSSEGLGVASYDLLGREFDSRRYWRGPVWANLNWLLARGLRQHGLLPQVEALEAATLRLVGGAGMHEYFDPLTGAGHGIADFSWTAAVTLDLVHSQGT